MRKTRLLWAIPLALMLAALFGAKWKLDHPTPTKEDLTLRSLFAHSGGGHVFYVPPTQIFMPGKMIELTSGDVKRLSLNLFLQGTTKYSESFGSRGSLRLFVYPAKASYPSSERVYKTYAMDIDLTTSQATLGQGPHIVSLTRLHTTSVRHILKTLFENPRIGPKLRDSMKEQ